MFPMQTNKTRFIVSIPELAMTDVAFPMHVFHSSVYQFLGNHNATYGRRLIIAF